MYQITIDNDGERHILHTDDPNSTQRIAAGKLKEYVGITPSLALTITPQNACYNMLSDRNTLVELKNTETGEIEIEGYLLKSPESMTSKGTLQKKLTFEGFLGYLNDSAQDYHNYTDQDAQPAQFLQALLDYHNATTEECKHIYLGMVNAGQGGSKTTAYRSTLAEIKENLINRFGGELRVRRGADGRLLLDYLTAATNGSTADTIVMLGHNLRSLSIESDTANIVTR
ncbi:MAG: phage tail protein, partial [Oscillospiraceae bacterium]|nr:phage tail protein [Oscillospiraceae bacterium]